MNMNDIDKYKREMMKLYSRRTPMEEYENNSNVKNYTQPSSQEITPEAPADANDTAAYKAESEEIGEESNELRNPISEEIADVDADAPDDSAWYPHSEEDFESTPYDEDEFNTRYPDPDLSDLGEKTEQNTTPPIYASVESLGDSVGYIKVSVRTGDDSSAIEGASVMVTAIVDGKRMIIAEGITDTSGNAPKFAVPVPDLILSQAPGSEIRPYNLFDVSVTAEGFFSSRSVDVPVFSGTTSVQNFNMIPLPLMMNPSDETVTYYNQEPDYPAGKE